MIVFCSAPSIKNNDGGQGTSPFSGKYILNRVVMNQYNIKIFVLKMKFNLEFNDSPYLKTYFLTSAFPCWLCFGRFFLHLRNIIKMRNICTGYYFSMNLNTQKQACIARSDVSQLIVFVEDVSAHPMGNFV